MVARQELPGIGVPMVPSRRERCDKGRTESWRDERHFNPYHTVPYGTDPG